MKKYFLHNGVDQQGPFDIDDLKTKNISRETPIWYDGINEWTTADKVDELKNIFSTIPPPFTTTTTTPPILPKKETKSAETNNHYIPQQKDKNRTKDLIIGASTITVIVLIVMFFMGAFSSNDSGTYGTSTDTYQEKVMTVEEIEKSQPTNFLTADGNYNQNIWGTKLKVHGTITNKATVATYKDALIRVTYYSKTKTELGSKEYTIYESFPPNSTKNFELKIENFKDVNTIGWDVVNATAN